MNIAELRQEFHASIVRDILRVSESRQQGGYPNFADGNNPISVDLAWKITEIITNDPTIGKLPGQTAGSRFEHATRDFLASSFAYLTHLRPGAWEYRCPGTAISNFVQYEHLAEIEAALKMNGALNAAFGGNYVVSPDVIVSRSPVQDDEINQRGILRDDSGQYARYTPLRAENYKKRRPFLHAVISCKWTLRNDRAQNTKTEVLNLIRNRKGHLPHVVAITAEPTPSRIAALALGTGDLDCVYHFALNELVEAVENSSYADGKDLLQMMIEGKRLRDISDLPFDLAA